MSNNRFTEFFQNLGKHKPKEDSPTGPNGYSNDIEEALVAARLGADAAAFFDSSIGRYLLQKATEVEMSAFRSFAEVDPKDAEAIRKIQEDQRIPKLVFAWLEDAITRLHDGRMVEVDGANGVVRFVASGT